MEEKANKVLQKVLEKILEDEATRELTFEFEVVRVNRKGEIISGKRKKNTYYIENLIQGVDIQMVYIPGGTFLMGAPETEKDSPSRERPQHEVTVAPFCIGCRGARPCAPTGVVDLWQVQCNEQRGLFLLAYLSR